MARPIPELEILFIDMDAFFASVEQMDNPVLRGHPLAVTPVLVPSGCCIACSYGARKQGVKTGCSVGAARKLCPGIKIIKARPDRYIAVHHEILAAIDTAIPVARVESVDECWCRLMVNERSAEAIERIAGAIKAAIARRVGTVTCSIGVAPNRLLAKTISGLNKPDGLTILPRSGLPGVLSTMALMDLPGISKGINRRLRASGIYTVDDLYHRSPPQLREAWGSVLGVYWWHWLRGDQLLGPTGRRRTIGHQHVLAPEFRSPDRARGVSLRLLAKATQRMRSLGYVATRLSLWLEMIARSSWGDWTPVARTNDTIELHESLLTLWHDAPRGDVLQIGVRLEGLEPIDSQLPLFRGEQHRRSLMDAIDLINHKVGADAVYLGAMHNERMTAPRRIPFGAPPSLDLPDRDGMG